jgi:predicted nucleic acid-binding protein
VRSTLNRLFREDSISESAFHHSWNRLNSLFGSGPQVSPSDTVRDLAVEYVDRFHLRAGDALQLGAAMTWCKLRPKGRMFICNDRRLAAAAQQIGFEVVGV